MLRIFVDNTIKEIKKMNKLYFGDCLDILIDLNQQYPQGFIDLIYIDPPFNSNRNYNILFEDVDMAETKAQKEAFKDTWSNVIYLDTLSEIHELDLDLYNFLHALDNINISLGAVSYLSTMAIRIYYMHKLLKETGSLYIHCDITMNHYLKILCDLIFGEKNFRNEIIWKRTSAGKPIYRNLPKNADYILMYTKSGKYKFNPVTVKLSKDDIKAYNLDDGDGRGTYNTQPIINPDNRPNLKYVYVDLHGRKWNPPPNGWRFNEERMRELEKDNRLFFMKKTIREKYFLADRIKKGKQISNVWIDIQNVAGGSNERLGFPTQKPIALMERIINASSNEGELVADFFCGCGTTIAAAEKLKRKWLGVDISHLAIKLNTKRLMDAYGTEIRKTFEIFGFPRDIASAHELAEGTKKGRMKFEEWIIEVMLHGVLNPRKTQTGFDGYLTFDVQGVRQTILIEVKSGNATLTQVNHFIKTVEEKEADMGLFVCFANQVTRGMEGTAKRQGFYDQDRFGTRYHKIQIITVDDLLNYNQPNIPQSTVGTFKSAERKIEEDDSQSEIEF